MNPYKPTLSLKRLTVLVVLFSFSLGVRAGISHSCVVAKPEAPAKGIMVND